jgi:hypothetical protein
MGKPSECLRGYGSKGAYPGRRPPRQSPARQTAASRSVAHTLTDKKTHLFDTANIPPIEEPAPSPRPPSRAVTHSDAPNPEMAGTLIVQC